MIRSADKYTGFIASANSRVFVRVCVCSCVSYGVWSGACLHKESAFVCDRDSIETEIHDAGPCCADVVSVDETIPKRFVSTVFAK